MSQIFYVFNGVPTTYAQFGAQVRERADELRPWQGQTIGLWADHDPDFIINLFAIWKIGGVPFLISRRLPWTTVSTLLENAEARTLLTPDPGARAGSLPVLSSVCGARQQGETAEWGHDAPAIGTEQQNIALILHTSGTTHVPKLVRISRANLLASLEFFQARWSGSWAEQDASLGWLPLFHVYGLCAELLQGYRMRSQYHFADNNPCNILRSLQKADGAITHLFAVPWMAQQLLDIPGGVQALCRLRYLILGGAALDETLGERLTSAGIRTVQAYGMTEVGSGLMSPLDGGDWRDLHPVIPERFWHLEEGTGQLIIHADCPTLAVSPLRDFGTGDMFRRTAAGGYRYRSRSDDILVHATGEKSNALVIEQMLLSRLGNLAEHVAVIGEGRLRLACIVQLKHELTPSDHATLLQSIATANAQLPAHSQLHEALLLLLPPSESERLPLTAKRTVARKKAELEFRAELEQLYAGSKQSAIGMAIESFFDRPQDMDRYTSLFNQGLDSLRAVALVGHIAKLYPSRDIPLNLVYRYPTLDALERYLRGVPPSTRNPPAYPPFSPEMIERARTDYPPARHILVTGANGFVGRHLIEALSRCERVEHVYCPIRCDPAGLPSYEKVTYYPGYDFADPLLGLVPEIYQALLVKVDTVIHAAWPVNFNATYEQMAESTLSSVHHLIDFVRHGDKTLHFLSSVSTVMLHPTKTQVDEEWPLQAPTACLPMGYAQTKWEAEQVIIRSGVRHKIYRMGQISAHSSTGRWNEQEHLPILLRASRDCRCTPRLPLPIDWVPVDVACRVLLDLMAVPGINIHHIANPRPRPAECLAQGTRCVPLEQWLEEVKPKRAAHPGLMTIWSFLEEMVAFADRLTPLAVNATCIHSPTLAACEPISDDYLVRLLK